MNKNITILGLQWGDEGKGKVVDYFTEGVDIVARFGGGANAGHTVVNDKGKFILHLLPSGIIRADVRCFMGGGMVCDPVALFAEIDDVTAKGVDCSNRLFIDYNMQFVLPHHKAIEKYYENLLKDQAINTTLRGIGPAYADKANRFGFTASDLLDETKLAEKTKAYIARKKTLLEATGDKLLLDPNYLLDFLKLYAQKLSGTIVDITDELRKAAAENKRILFEGSQGSMLDISLGNYPYVTSSNTTIGGLFTGLGMPPGIQGEVLGVVKAYTTRVGNGPFPSELKDKTGDFIREKGGEYGATTGRPRRTGWLDTAIVKRAAYMSGVTGVIVTKLDVLDGIEEIKVCTGHRVDSKTYDFPPLYASFMEKAEPIFESLPGWKNPTANITDNKDLPKEAKSYLTFIEKQVGVPIKYISTGSKRSAFIKNT